MGRDLSITAIAPTTTVGVRRLLIANTHLESRDSEYRERAAQLTSSFTTLTDVLSHSHFTDTTPFRSVEATVAQPTVARAGDEADAVLMGDMNINEESTEAVVNASPFTDVYVKYRHTHSSNTDAGYTKDSSINSIIQSTHKQCRPDRVFVRLSHWEVTSIRRVGMTQIEEQEKAMELPSEEHVWPSDHFGLLTTLRVRTDKLWPLWVSRVLGWQ